MAEAGIEIVTLYRPTGKAELALVEESGWTRWPTRLPDQPIFYPVLNFEYAEKIARDWNAKLEGYGCVTKFAVEKAYLNQFSVHQVGGETILEYWVPAEELAEFNNHIVGLVEVIAEYFPDN